MRQLKFRIWDRQHKRFVDNDAGTHCSSRWLLDAFTGRPVDFVVGFEDPEFGSLSQGEDYYIEGTKVVNEPCYVVQQFTDALDKDGVEIYIGDFVEYHMYGKPLPFLVEEHSDGISMVYSGSPFCRERLWFPAHYKVIGNIFENPELLETR